MGRRRLSFCFSVLLFTRTPGSRGALSLIRGRFLLRGSAPVRVPGPPLLHTGPSRRAAVFFTPFFFSLVQWPANAGELVGLPISETRMLPPLVSSLDLFPSTSGCFL